MHYVLSHQAASVGTVPSTWNVLLILPLAPTSWSIVPLRASLKISLLCKVFLRLIPISF